MERERCTRQAPAHFVKHFDKRPTMCCQNTPSALLLFPNRTD
jgi:hypothetical protein